MKRTTVKWIATAILVVGSLQMAANNFPLAFIMMAGGASLYAWVAFKEKDWPLTVINGWMMLMQTIATINYIF